MRRRRRSRSPSGISPERASADEASKAIRRLPSLLQSEMTFLRIVIPLCVFLFEHDLFEKTGSHFSGSCSEDRRSNARCEFIQQFCKRFGLLPLRGVAGL